MMITNTHILTTEFELFEPRTVDEVVDALSMDNTAVMAGGTDLLVQMKLERRHLDRVISLSRIAELNAIEPGEELALGATVSIEAIASNHAVRERYTALAEACAAFSTVAITAMGTVGGNLCNASPASDTAPALLVFDARADVVSSSGSRLVGLDEFFIGPGRTVLTHGALLRSVRLPKRPASSGSAFIKVARVEADISKVCAAVSLVRNGNCVADCRIALGAVAPTPVRAREAERALEGERLTNETLARTVRCVRDAIAPITDQRSTAEYRRFVAGVIVGDALRKAWTRAGGEGIE